MQTEFLVRNESKDAVANISVRFLQPLARDVGRLSPPVGGMETGMQPAFEVVPRLEVDEKLYQTWQEAIEREVTLAADPPEWRGATGASVSFRGFQSNRVRSETDRVDRRRGR